VLVAARHPSQYHVAFNINHGIGEPLCFTDPDNNGVGCYLGIRALDTELCEKEGSAISPATL